MFKWQRFHLVLAVYGLLVSIGAFITALAIIMIPSDPRNSVFLGFSLQRLGLISIPTAAGTAALFFAIKAYRDQVYANRVWKGLFGNAVIASGIRWGAIAIFATGWIASFTPLYRFWDFKDYFVRISPIVIWLTFACALTIAVSWVEKYVLHWRNLLDVLRAQKKLLIVMLISLTIFTLTWVLIASTGMGIQVSEDYWYGAGVPILGLQILLALTIGLCVYFGEHFWVKFPSWSDLFIFALIWGIAAFLWMREPLVSSFFAPGPYPPDLEYHPYSDGAIFDLASQFALIGQGINNGVFFDRALYMGFLVFLHAIAGQDYTQVVTLQAAIYAVLPSILYLLGKSIHSRAFGVTLAVLTILRGINGLEAGGMIDLANPKQMLTDFPIAIFAAWFAVMMVKWLKSPDKNYPYVVWAGGIIGLAIMLRTHALFLLLLAILFAILVYRNQKTRGLIVITLLVIAMFTSILPWGMRSGGSVFDVYMYRIRLILQQRYPDFLPTTTPEINTQEVSPTAIIPVPQDGVTIAAPGLDAVTPGANNPSSVDAGGGAQSTTIPVSVATHFLHNVVTSFFILPTSLVNHDLWHIFKEATPFWKQYWDGSLDLGSILFLIFNLIMVSLGISIAWKYARLAGLVPLGIFLFYNLANAFARTSGGRYIVPTDWVVLLYFALGFLQVALWGLALFNLQTKEDGQGEIRDLDGEDRTSWTWKPLKKTPWIFLLFLFFGSLLPLSEELSPKRYTDQTQAELLITLDEKGYLREMGFDMPAMQALLDQWPSLKIINGRALYPRYFPKNKGESKREFPYLVLGYPRIGFTVIGPQGINYVILPEDQINYFPNASDVFVLGCQEGTDVSALAVVVIQEKTVVYTRHPSSPLQCPLQEPVCDESHPCK